MGRFALGLLTVLLAFGLASAQNHGLGYAGTSARGELFLVGPSHRITTLSLGAGACDGCVMDPENRHLLVTTQDGRIVRVDPRAGAVVGTLAGGLVGALDIAVDHHGDCFVTGPSCLWRVTPAGTVTTVLTGLGRADGGMDVDTDTGDLVVQTRGGPNTLIRVDRRGATWTTLGTGGDPRYGIAQDVLTGDVYIGSCCGDFVVSENIYVLRRGAAVASLWLKGVVDPAGVYSLKVDRAGAALRRLIVGALFQSSLPGRGGGFYAVDLDTRAVTSLSGHLPSLHESEILFRRNVFSRALAPGRWELGVHVPEDAGRLFLLAAGVSGVRPGLALPDGRTVALVTDVVTLTGLFFGLRPFVGETLGKLDASGRAATTLDLRTLGPAANGALLWFVVLTLDPAAPAGIATVTDPLVFPVEGL
jgi:hypothetical protein